MRHGGYVAGMRHGGQKIVFSRSHQVGVHGGAGRDDARDIALHQFLGEPRIFHLVADGDAVPFLNEARDVAVGGVIGHAAHGDGGALFLVARGQGDFQIVRGHYGIFEEELVKIAEAEHEERVRHLLLDAVVLPHQRRGGISRGRRPS